MADKVELDVGLFLGHNIRRGNVKECRLSKSLLGTQQQNNGQSAKHSKN